MIENDKNLFVTKNISLFTWEIIYQNIINIIRIISIKTRASIGKHFARRVFVVMELLR